MKSESLQRTDLSKSITYASDHEITGPIVMDTVATTTQG